MSIEIPPLLRSELSTRLLFLDGAPFSMEDYPFYPAIYDGDDQGLLLKCGRQVAKSTTLCNFTVSESIGKPHFRSLYVSPSQEQTQTFSNTRIAKVVHYSPLVRRFFTTRDFTARTMLRMFKNGAEVKFTYACDDPDRARGNTADRVCYDKTAYVLTKRGWVLVKDLREWDQVADVNDQGVVEWNCPEEIFAKKHTGEMVTFAHRGFHLRVTGDHRVWVNYRVKPASAYRQPDRYEFVPALALATTQRMGFKMTCKAEWLDELPGETYRVFDGSLLSRYGVEEYLRLPWSSFAALTGWYIAEGSLDRRRYAEGGTCYPRPIISQNEGRGLQDILDAVQTCHLSHRINHGEGERRGVYINSLSLGRYFQPLGLARDKFIPREFFDKPHTLVEILKGIYKGDACYHEGEAWDQGTLRTRSRRLAEDVQEAWLRLNRPAPIHTRELEGEPLYEVCAYKHDYQIFWRADFETKQRVRVETVEDEDVYCFTVPHHRPIVKGNFESLPVISGQCYDEVQDILYEAVIPVVNECTANSKYGYETYAGTPKTMENTIEYLWSISTQTEWIMRCSGCGNWNFIDSAASIGLTAPICLRCGKNLQPRDGRWYSFNPDTPPSKDPTVKPSVKIKGYHISQPMLPLNNEDPARWQRLLNKLERYSETKFKNEVLGVSDAIGARLISKQELEELCKDYDIYRTAPTNAEHYSHICGGIDWSGGGVEGVSRTVIWVFGITDDHRLKTLYFRIYPVVNPITIVEDIIEVLRSYNVELTLGDRGEGHLPNKVVQQAMGRTRVAQVSYGMQAKPIVWAEDADCYRADRTTLMDNYFMVLKRGGVIYPRITYMKDAITDVLNLYEEVTSSGKKVWRHAPTQPDDCFHAQLFAWLAAKIVMMDLQFQA